MGNAICDAVYQDEEFDRLICACNRFYFRRVEDSLIDECGHIDDCETRERYWIQQSRLYYQLEHSIENISKDGKTNCELTCGGKPYNLQEALQDALEDYIVK